MGLVIFLHSTSFYRLPFPWGRSSVVGVLPGIALLPRSLLLLRSRHGDGAFLVFPGLPGILQAPRYLPAASIIKLPAHFVFLTVRGSTASIMA